jgi:hypothetical protein
MSMLGSRGVDNTLSGLVSVVTDPDRFKSALAELQAATAKHRAEREAAVQAKAEAAKAAADADTKVADANKALAELTKVRDTVAFDKVSIANQRRLHEEAVDAEIKRQKAVSDAHIANIAAQDKRISDAKDDLARQYADFERTKEQISSQQDKRSKELNVTALSHTARENELRQREDAVAKQELDLRLRVQKLNELFPAR